MSNLNVNNIYKVNGSLSTNIISWEIPITSNVDNPSAFVEIDYPSDFAFSSVEYTSINTSVYDDATKRWTIPLKANEIAKLKLYLTFTSPTQLDKVYNFIAGVNGLDTNPDNNEEPQVLVYKSVSSEPLGSATSGKHSIVTVDVSKNDTKCSEGVTEWRLNETSIVNGTLISWDVLTGIGSFKFTDITKDISFKYDLYCVNGTEEYKMTCDVVEEICALSTSLQNKHTHQLECYDDLSDGDKLVLNAQYPDLDISKYCWNALRDGNGDLTSGIPNSCLDETYPYFTYSIVSEDYDPNSPQTGVSFPTNNGDGDVHIVSFNNGDARFVYAEDTEVWTLNKFTPTTVSNPSVTAHTVTPHATDPAKYVSTITDSSGNTFPAEFTISWTRLTNIPGGFADNVDDEGVLTTTLDWDNITNKPAGFADNVDNEGTGSAPDGNDFVSNFVRGNGSNGATINDLIVTGTGGAFDGVIPNVFLNTGNGSDNDTITTITKAANEDFFRVLVDGTEVDQISILASNIKTVNGQNVYGTGNISVAPVDENIATALNFNNSANASHSDTDVPLVMTFTNNLATATTRKLYFRLVLADSMVNVALVGAQSASNFYDVSSGLVVIDTGFAANATINIPIEVDIDASHYKLNDTGPVYLKLIPTTTYGLVDPIAAHSIITANIGRGSS